MANKSTPRVKILFQRRIRCRAESTLAQPGAGVDVEVKAARSLHSLKTAQKRRAQFGRGKKETRSPQKTKGTSQTKGLKFLVQTE